MKNALEDVHLQLGCMLLSCNFTKNELLLFQYFEHNCRTTLLYKTSQWLPRNSSISFLVTKSIKKHNTISLFFMNTVGVYCLLSEIITFVFTLKDRVLFDLNISLAIFPEFFTFIWHILPHHH